MNKKYFSKFKIKDKVLKYELIRAHGVIVLLVLTLMTTLALATTFQVEFDPILSFIAVVLLAIVGLLSLSVILAITQSRK
jgi:hypothetical protein